MLIDDEAMRWMSPEAREKCMDQLRRAFPNTTFESWADLQEKWRQEAAAKRSARVARRKAEKRS